MPGAVDAHFHLWVYEPHELDWISEKMSVLRRDFLAADAAGEFAGNGVRGGVVVQARSSLAENDFLLAERAASSAILGVVGWVDLCAEDVGATLERYAGALVGVRHIVQAEPDSEFLLRPDFQRGVDLLDGFGMTYDILIRPQHLPAACTFADRNPGLRLVVDHLAKPRIAAGLMEPWATDFRELAERPNVHLKASGLVTEAHWGSWTAEQLRAYLDVAFEAFGAERIMFGSDYPVCLLAASYEQVMSGVTGYIAALSDNERSLVLAENAIQFYRLPG
jgi:L-fuconolactonase